jgi:Tripartite tricarboxylate transporter family receptor
MILIMTEPQAPLTRQRARYVLGRQPPIPPVSFINHAHANRGMLTYASGGVGTTPHLSAELLKSMARIEMVHVPYVGINSSPFSDLIGGRLDTWFSNLPAMLPHIRAGALRALAVTSAARSPFAPDIPTFAESGVPGFDVTAWFALFVPARTPAGVVARIRNDTVAVLDGLGISALKVNPDPVMVATEGALWGSIKAHGFLPNTVIVSDDAGQFNVGQHGLCWVHAERLVHKLDTLAEGLGMLFSNVPRRSLQHVTPERAA